MTGVDSIGETHFQKALGVQESKHEDTRHPYCKKSAVTSEKVPSDVCVQRRF